MSFSSCTVCFFCYPFVKYVIKHSRLIIAGGNAGGRVANVFELQEDKDPIWKERNPLPMTRTDFGLMKLNVFK